MTEAPSKSFTSWKLDVWNAISMDAELAPTERLVAFRLLQHANSESREIFPTQRTIAVQLGISEGTIKASIALLVRRGWFKVTRRAKRRSNKYEVCEHLIGEILDDVTSAIESDEPNTRVRNRTLKKPVRGAKSHRDKGVKSHPEEGAKSHHNNLRLEHLAQDHLATPAGDRGDTQGDQATDNQPPGAVAPHNASRDGGRVTTPTPSAAIINSTAYKRELASRPKVDPFTSLDRLEAEQIKRRAGGAR